MIPRTKIIIFTVGLISFISFAQIDAYSYKRPLENYSDAWHTITIPDAVFEKIANDFSDIRIYGITQKKDTIEVPYVLRSNAEQDINKVIPFSVINSTQSLNGYYYTFKLESEQSINTIHLDFNVSNFDWRVKLEGSQNQLEWFTILDNFRILSIKNEETDYKFTKLSFPDSKYRFFRLLINSKANPQLKASEITEQQISEGIYRNHDIFNFEVTNNKQDKITEVQFQFASALPVNTITVNVDSKIDYYRPLKIEYLADSIKTEKGWNYRYNTLLNGTLSSLGTNSFNFPNVIAKTFRVRVYNHQNQPIRISSVVAKGSKYQLVARFTEKASYVMVYGNKNVTSPNYDINRFSNAIPDVLTDLKLGQEDRIETPGDTKPSALFENKYWLWGIMGFIIVLLGGLTLNMIKKKS